MKVSIIIPIYRVEEEIQRCIESVVKQDYKDLEIILVNDCTPDESFEIALECMKPYSQCYELKFISHNINKGISEARNTGIKASTGDYIMFLDSDDALFSTTVISALLKEAERYNFPDAVLGGYERIIGSDRRAYYVDQDIYYQDNKAIYKAYIGNELCISAWGRIIKRDFLVKEGLYFYPNIYYEDDLWAFNFYSKINNMRVVPYAVCLYIAREGSITSRITEKHIASWNTVVLEIYKAYLKDKSYYPKLTIQKIEYLRRLAIQKMVAVTKSNPSFIKAEIGRLKQVKLPVFGTSKTSNMRANLLFRFPISLIFWVISNKSITS